jgi:hypothetical protein
MEPTESLILPPTETSSSQTQKDKESPVSKFSAIVDTAFQQIAKAIESIKNVFSPKLERLQIEEEDVLEKINKIGNNKICNKINQLKNKRDELVRKSIERKSTRQIDQIDQIDQINFINQINKINKKIESLKVEDKTTQARLNKHKKYLEVRLKQINDEINEIAANEIAALDHIEVGLDAISLKLNNFILNLGKRNANTEKNTEFNDLKEITEFNDLKEITESLGELKSLRKKQENVSPELNESFNFIDLKLSELNEILKINLTINKLRAGETVQKGSLDNSEKIDEVKKNSLNEAISKRNELISNFKLNKVAKTQIKTPRKINSQEINDVYSLQDYLAQFDKALSNAVQEKPENLDSKILQEMPEIEIEKELINPEIEIEKELINLEKELINLINLEKELINLLKDDSILNILKKYTNAGGKVELSKLYLDMKNKLVSVRDRKIQYFELYNQNLKKDLQHLKKGLESKPTEGKSIEELAKIGIQIGEVEAELQRLELEKAEFAALQLTNSLDIIEEKLNDIDNIITFKISSSKHNLNPEIYEKANLYTEKIEKEIKLLEEKFEGRIPDNKKAKIETIKKRILQRKEIYEEYSLTVQRRPSLIPLLMEFPEILVADPMALPPVADSTALTNDAWVKAVLNTDKMARKEIDNIFKEPSRALIKDINRSKSKIDQMTKSSIKFRERLPPTILNQAKKEMSDLREKLLIMPKDLREGPLIKVLNSIDGHLEVYEKAINLINEKNLLLKVLGSTNSQKVVKRILNEIQLVNKRQEKFQKDKFLIKSKDIETLRLKEDIEKLKSEEQKISEKFDFDSPIQKNLLEGLENVREKIIRKDKFLIKSKDIETLRLKEDIEKLKLEEKGILKKLNPQNRKNLAELEDVRKEIIRKENIQMELVPHIDRLNRMFSNFNQECDKFETSFKINSNITKEDKDDLIQAFEEMKENFLILKGEYEIEIDKDPKWDGGIWKAKIGQLGEKIMKVSSLLEQQKIPQALPKKAAITLGQKIDEKKQKIDEKKRS